ncbi:flagellar hook-basal body complex protein FliE [Ornatilinea apprima]|uniref:flagellar hook-basal body complex protein FliE n=1 Tax=Ornatilinea apprima TaxID=1134406 RepID=UPI0009467B4E|nr:flagellar hook-basal body complex protein FliE [Ornatilinea apprima]
MEIRTIYNPISNTASAASAPKSETQPLEKTFGDILKGLTASENNANDMVQKLAMGEDVELHDVMLAVEENDVNFRVAMAIRDRLVEAYQEVMRMNI